MQSFKRTVWPYAHEQITVGKRYCQTEDSQINLQERVFVSLPGDIHTSLHRRVQISGGDNIDSFF